MVSCSAGFRTGSNFRAKQSSAREKLEKTKEEIASRGGEFVPTIKLDDRDLQAADLQRGRSARRLAERRGDSGCEPLDALDWTGRSLSCDQARRFARMCAVARRQPQRRAVAGHRSPRRELAGRTISTARSCKAPTSVGAQLQGANLGVRTVAGRGSPRSAVAGCLPRGRAVAGCQLVARRFGVCDLGETSLQGANTSFASLTEWRTQRNHVAQYAEHCQREPDRAVGDIVQLTRITIQQERSR